MTPQYLRFSSLLSALIWAGSACAADTPPVIDWLSPEIENTPFSIVISQPAPSLIFATDAAQTTRVRLAVSHATPAEGLALTNTAPLPDSSGLLNNNWSVMLEMEQQAAQSLAALGEIRCRDGYFSASGYTASGCQAAVSSQRFRLGGSVTPLPGVELDVGLFDQSAQYGSTLSPLDQAQQNAALLASTPLTVADSFADDSTGVDLNLRLNSSNLPIGQFKVDLAMAEYLHTQTNAATAFDFNPPWLTSSQLLRQAKVHLGWSKGSFSGGVEGIYQAYQPDSLTTTANDWSTFNLYFSWNTPWNGSFSIGATNLLDASLEDRNSNQPDSRQPLDGIFGRVPYVRYKQDL
ncbi:MAG: hypothetical protein Tsb002_17430 [Wenzhouxiangellaceae bacterium]